MGKPRTGFMGPHQIVIQTVPELTNAYGLFRKTDEGVRTINISEAHNKNPIDFCDTVVHESVHVAADVYGFEDREQLCHTLAAALVQFWVDIGLVDPLDWQKRLSGRKSK